MAERVSRKLDAIDRRLIEKEFASFKFRVINALIADRRLEPSHKVVAIALLQHMNRDTGDIFPSIDLLAEKTGLSPRTVRYCLGSLRDAGWIDWSRGNRQRANSYAILTDNLEREGATERRSGQRGRSGRVALPERQSIATQAPPTLNASGNGLPFASGNPLPPNTLREHLKKAAG